jgi:hypothetical protein
MNVALNLSLAIVVVATVIRYATDAHRWHCLAGALMTIAWALAWWGGEVRYRRITKHDRRRPALHGQQQAPAEVAGQAPCPAQVAGTVSLSIDVRLRRRWQIFLAALAVLLSLWRAQVPRPVIAWVVHYGCQVRIGRRWQSARSIVA